MESEVVLVVSPLKSLMENQVQEIKEIPLNISTARLESCTKSEVNNGQFNILFGSPESWLEMKTWRDMISTKFFKRNVVAIVVDEAHLVTWYVL